jgi:hypothetical protein
LALAFLAGDSFSAEDKDLIAASGKYRSPVLEDGFPDLVRHFWSPQFLREVCGAFNLCIPRPKPCTSWLPTELSLLTTDLRQYHVLLRL